MVDRAVQPAINRILRLGYPLVNSDSIRLVFENPHTMPRCFVVGELRASEIMPWEVGSTSGALATSTDKELSAEAVQLGIGQGMWSAAITESHNGRVRVRAKLSKPGLLILTDSWSPRWSATIDGRQAHVARVDMTFRGVAVPAGEHEILFRYRLLSLVLGKVLSAVALALLAAYLVLWSRRARDLSHAATN